jgi:hypothetical protein
LKSRRKAEGLVGGLHGIAVGHGSGSEVEEPIPAYRRPDETEEVPFLEALPGTEKREPVAHLAQLPRLRRVRFDGGHGLIALVDSFQVLPGEGVEELGMRSHVFPPVETVGVEGLPIFRRKLPEEGSFRRKFLHQVCGIVNQNSCNAALCAGRYPAYNPGKWIQKSSG